MGMGLGAEIFSIFASQNAYFGAFSGPSECEIALVLNRREVKNSCRSITGSFIQRLLIGELVTWAPPHLGRVMGLWDPPLYIITYGVVYHPSRRCRRLR